MVDPPPIFSDAQFGILISVISAIGAGLIGTAKWAVNRVVKAIDEAAAEQKKHTEAFILMTAKVDEVHGWVQDHTPVEDEGPYRRRSTPAGGVKLRSASRSEDR